MVDASWVAPIITAVITYVRAQGAQKAADKMAEVVDLFPALVLPEAK